MVEFRTKLNKEAVESLNKRQFKKSIWLFVCLGIIFIALGVLFICTNEIFDEDGWLSVTCIMGITWIIAGFVVPIVFLFIFKTASKRQAKQTSYVSEDTEEVFTFDETYLTISQKRGEDYEAYTKAKYSYIIKAEETSTHYYLYISSTQCHVVPKDSLTQGTLVEMTAHLINNLKTKYIKLS